jgi:Na+/H+ antiporter NhaC
VVEGKLHRTGAQLAADMENELSEAASAPRGRWWNGAIPVATLVITVLWGLVYTGLSALGPDDERILRNIFGNADPFTPLLWGSVLGCVVAVGLAVLQRILSVAETMSAWLGGLKAMFLAVVILLLAWSLGEVTQTLGTAPYLTQLLSERMPPQMLPTAVFVVASLIAFATGTSWATMAILVPLVVPLSIALTGGLTSANDVDQALVLGAIGSVLAGAILGDHW